MLTIALAKGRLLKSFIAYLESQGQNDLAAQLKSRERQLQIKVSPFHFYSSKAMTSLSMSNKALLILALQAVIFSTKRNTTSINCLHFLLANVTFQSQHLTRQRTIAKSQLLFLKQQEIILKRQDVMSN